MLGEYQVGRGTLREALRFLEMQGVLTIKPGPGGGPVVDAVDSRVLASNLALMLALDQTPFRAILDVRHTLEPTLASRSAEREDDLLLDEMLASVQSMASHAGDQRRIVLENRSFHELIATRAGNPVFVHLVSALNWIIDGTALGVHFPETQVRATAEAHRRIYEAIAAREPAGAATAMRTHLAEFTHFLENQYPETLDVPLRWEGAR